MIILECQRKKQLIETEINYIFNHLSDYFDRKYSVYNGNDFIFTIPWTVTISGYDTDHHQVYLPYEIHLTGYVKDDEMTWKWLIYIIKPNTKEIYDKKPIIRIKRSIQTIYGLVKGGQRVVDYFLSYMAMPTPLKDEFADMLCSFCYSDYMFYTDTPNSWKLAIKHRYILYVVHVELDIRSAKNTRQAITNNYQRQETDYSNDVKDNGRRFLQYKTAVSRWSLTIGGDAAVVIPLNEGRMARDAVKNRLIEFIRSYSYDITEETLNTKDNNYSEKEISDRMDVEGEGEEMPQEKTTNRIVTARYSYNNATPRRLNPDVLTENERDLKRKISQRKEDNNEEVDDNDSLDNYLLYRPYKSSNLIFNFNR